MKTSDGSEEFYRRYTAADLSLSAAVFSYGSAVR